MSLMSFGEQGHGRCPDPFAADTRWPFTPGTPVVRRAMKDDPKTAALLLLGLAGRAEDMKAIRDAEASTSVGVPRQLDVARNAGYGVGDPSEVRSGFTRTAQRRIVVGINWYFRIGETKMNLDPSGHRHSVGGLTDPAPGRWIGLVGIQEGREIELAIKPSHSRIDEVWGALKAAGVRESP